MTIINSTPVAKQVFSLLLERIRAGYYLPGSRMPSETDIAAELNVSRDSVRSALARLETSGHISRRHGEGTFIRKRSPANNVAIGVVWEFSNLIRETGREPLISVHSLVSRPALPVESEALEIGESEEVIEIVRLFFANGDPVIYTLNVIPQKFLKAEAAEIKGELQIMEILEKYFGLEVAYIDTSISSVFGSAEVDQALGLGVCTPLLRLEEVFIGGSEELPILYSDSYLNTMKIGLHRIRPWGWSD